MFTKADITSYEVLYILAGASKPITGVFETRAEAFKVAEAADEANIFAIVRVPVAAIGRSLLSQ